MCIRDSLAEPITVGSWSPKIDHDELENFPHWEHLDYPEHTFDIVFCASSILDSFLLGWHINQMAYVLRPGGLLIVMVPNIWNRRFRLRRYEHQHRPDQLQEHLGIEASLHPHRAEYRDAEPIKDGSVVQSDKRVFTLQKRARV